LKTKKNLENLRRFVDDNLWIAGVRN